MRCPSSFTIKSKEVDNLKAKTQQCLPLGLSKTKTIVTIIAVSSRSFSWTRPLSTLMDQSLKNHINREAVPLPAAKISSISSQWWCLRLLTSMLLLGRLPLTMAQQITQISRLTATRCSNFFSFNIIKSSLKMSLKQSRRFKSVRLTSRSRSKSCSHRRIKCLPSGRSI